MISKCSYILYLSTFTCTTHALTIHNTHYYNTPLHQIYSSYHTYYINSHLPKHPLYTSLTPSYQTHSLKPREANSTLLNDKFLRTMDHYYKNSFLPAMRKSGEVVEIDWNEPADKMDMDVVSAHSR